jgi:hypothetical protein
MVSMNRESVTRLRLRDKVRRLPAGDGIVHAGVFLLGAAFIGLGLALVVLPGPLTIPPVLVGLAIWSLEFEFAQRLLDRATASAQQAWDQAKLHPWRTGLVTGGGLVLLAVGVVLAVRFELVDHARGVFT